MIASATNAATLESAFNAFNEQSALLESSYRELQQQVASLTARLDESQSARHRELLAKERLGEQLANTLEALPGAVVVLDSRGVISECNALAATLLNQPLLGRPWSEIAKREFAPVDNADGELQLHDGRVLSLHRRRLGRDLGEILLLTDVSETRRMTEMLARQQRLSAIGEMTARLAHQIRTPLASALLYASQMSPGDSSAASPGGKVVARLRELDRMVDDMLQFASGSNQDDEGIDVALLLADVAETGSLPMDAASRVAVNVADSNLRIAGNRGALKGALLNLLDNALIACGDEGRVDLGAWRDADCICLTVSDNGCGIPDEELA
ncbi:MAG: histidine kinase dimerization/phospho-acceptor domain-containing protein, partial [Woeseia sp.]